MKRRRDSDEGDDNGAKRTDLSVAAKSFKVLVKYENDACPFLSAPPEQEVIDPDGDLHLTVGKNKCTVTTTKLHKHKPAVTFRVDSRALIRACLTWKHLLQQDRAGRSAKDMANGLEWHVYFPDDDPYAMRAILDTVHGRFKLADTVTNVYSVTVLTSKYDLAEALRPWAARWTPRWKKGLMLCNVFDDTPEIEFHNSGVHERHIWMFAELGERVRFYEVVKKVAKLSYKTANGKLSTNRASGQPGELFSNSEEVPGVYELIAQTRLETIRDLLNPIRASLDLLLGNSTDSGARAFLYCKPDNSQTVTAETEQCRSMILSSLSKSLAARQLWPIPDDNSVSLSPEDVGSVLNTMDIHHEVHHHPHQHAFYQEIDAHVTRCMDVDPDRTKQHLSHLKAQAGKTDVGNYPPTMVPRNEHVPVPAWMKALPLRTRTQSP